MMMLKGDFHRMQLFMAISVYDRYFPLHLTAYANNRVSGFRKTWVGKGRGTQLGFSFVLDVTFVTDI